MSHRSYIETRRARFIAATLAGSLSGCGQCNPLVCLSPMRVSPDGGTDAGAVPAPADASVRQTLVGLARDGKAGPAIIVDGAPVYVVGLEAWPEAWVGRRVEVTGDVVERQGLPDPAPGELPVAGIVGAYRVIENGSWRLLD